MLYNGSNSKDAGLPLTWADVIDSKVSCGIEPGTQNLIRLKEKRVTMMKSGFNTFVHDFGYAKSLCKSFRPPCIAAAKIDDSCSDGTLERLAHVLPNLLHHLSDDQRQLIKG